jgi:hypothetical protein
MIKNSITYSSGRKATANPAPLIDNNNVKVLGS